MDRFIEETYRDEPMRQNNATRGGEAPHGQAIAVVLVAFGWFRDRLRPRAALAIWFPSGA